jgi:hypothetical protein
MKIKAWLKNVGIRCVKTMAETALSLISADAVGVMDVDWLGVLSAVILAAIYTVLLNLKQVPEGEGK